MKKIVMLLAAVCAMGAFASELGVTVNGVDVGDGFGEGWYYDTTTHYVEVTGGGAYVLSGTNTSGQVMFSIDSDAEVTLSNLCLRCTTADECCFWATNDVNVTLFLAGTNTLDASGRGGAEMGEGLCIENGTRLTITNAPSYADADAVLIARGSYNRAAIAVGRNGTEGTRPYFEIAGGTVRANWFDAPARWSAGIGASYKTGKNGEADIVISGGFVFARGGHGDPGIGAADYESAGAPDISITGGYVEAEGGEGAAAIGGGLNGKYGTVTVAGGTVRATGGGSEASDMIAGGSTRGGGAFRITGGSVVLGRGTVAPAPSNGTDRVWCVTVTNLTPNATATVTGLDGYGTNDVVADGDGKIYLWLPNGERTFDVKSGGTTRRYSATVNGADITATHVARVFGVTINGREAGLGPEPPNDGWSLVDGTNVVFYGTQNGLMLSGTNVDASLVFSVPGDIASDSVAVGFADLSLSSAGKPFVVAAGKKLSVSLFGTSFVSGVIQGDVAILGAEEDERTGSLSIAGEVAGTLEVGAGRIDLGGARVKNLKVADGVVTWNRFNGDSVIIDGGSVRVADLAEMNPAPTNSDGAALWCVTVPVGDARGKVTVTGATDLDKRFPGYYGLQHIFTDDGRVCLWLPNGEYQFSAEFGAGPIPYAATVDGGHVDALVDSDRLTGVTVNGRDTGLGAYDGCGWKRTEDKYVELDGTVGSYVIAGSNDVGNVMIAVNGNASVTLSNLYLRCTTQNECCFWATNNTTVALYLAGTNTLDASGSGDAYAEMGEGICIENGTRLTITNAPGFADADAVLIARGSYERAAIAVGRNGAEGARPSFEIAGGTVCANWFDAPALWSAGIGASYKTGQNGEADIVISGGFVFARGGYEDPGIGAADFELAGAPDISITGGYVEAVGGYHAAAIGGGQRGKYGNVRVAGGTVRATGGEYASDMIAGHTDKVGGAFRIVGGSVVLGHGTVAPAPSNGTDRVWCVTVADLSPNAAVTVTGLGDYGTKDIVADGDGKVCLWLPNGNHSFTVNCGYGDLHYTAAVGGANTVAVVDETQLSGLKVNGRFVCFGPAANDGWDLEGNVLAIAGAGKTYAITNTLSSWWDGNIDVRAKDVTVVLEAMNVRTSSGNALRVASGASAVIQLSGKSSLCSKEGQMATVNVPYGASVTITNAPGAAIAELNVTHGSGTSDCAGIGGNYRQNCGNITIAGGRVFATNNMRGAGIGGGMQSSGACGTIRITGGYVEATGGSLGGSGIGSGRRCLGVGANTPPIVISGGTVKATGNYYAKNKVWGSDIGRGAQNSGGSVTILGGSVLDVSGHIAPAPNANNVRVWRVTVTNLEANATATVTGLGDYGTNDIVADASGKIYLWLPNGIHNFSVNGADYVARVANANTTARFSSELTGVTVNGIDAGFGSGEGWYYDATTNCVKVTGGGGTYVLSGTNTSGQVMFSIDCSATVTLDNLCIKAPSQRDGGGVIKIETLGTDVNLLLSGTNTLDFVAESNAAGIFVSYAKLTIDNAPGCRGSLTVTGGHWGAGIGGYCSENGEIVINGGDITATGGEGSAGIGSGYLDVSPHANGLITINGGRIVATAGWGGALSIGCPKNRGDGAPIRITGGTVIAKDGIGASEDYGNGCTNTFTGGSIYVGVKTLYRWPVDEAGASVWCVTVTNLEANATATVTGLDGYGTKDVVADGDGKIYLWLPNGSYGFSVNGAYYVAEVQDANVIATRFSGELTGVTVNGIDAGFGSGKGWTFAAKWLKISSPGEYVLSGSATDFGVEIISDATVTLDNLCIKAPEMTGGGGVIKMLTPETDVNLLLSGTNKLELAAGSKAAGINVRFAKLTIDNAPGCRGSLTVTGGDYGAGIGGYCSENGEIVINGGDITATGGYASAGIGSGYWYKNPHANGPITINGGRIQAKGDLGGCSIGCPANKGDGAPIRITGGTVIATQGIGASIPGGNGCTNTFTGGSIYVGDKTLYRWPVDEAGASVWCVTVTNLAPNATATVTGLDDYGTNDVVADGDGKIYLWLPNGSYYFSVNGAYYVAEVRNANTIATQVVGLPVTPGEKAGEYETAAAATNAARTAYVLPREDVADALATDAARSAYAQMFGFIVTGEGVIWSVEAELTPPAWSNLVESAAAATRQVPVADIATGAETSFTATNCVPGFFYSLRSGTKLDTLSTDGSRTNVLCGADKSVAPGEVPFGPVAKPSDAVGFFTVGVQVAP